MKNKRSARSMKLHAKTGVKTDSHPRIYKRFGCLIDKKFEELKKYGESAPKIKEFQDFVGWHEAATSIKKGLRATSQPIMC